MSFGIEAGYPKLPLHLKLKGYIQLMRPFTLLPALLAGIFLTLASTPISWEAVKVAVYAGVTLALLQCVGQIVNQAKDAELDKIAKPYRPIPRGVVDRDEAMGIAWILSIVALARSFTLGLIFGGLSLLLLFFAVFYSLPPISPRKHAVLSLVWQAFSRGFLPPILCFSIYSNIQEALPYSTISFLWALGWQGSKDIGDIEADRRFGIKTLANTWGLKKLRIFTLSFTIIYIIYVVALGKLIFLLLIPLAALGLAKYTSKSKATENTVSWAVFYVGLGLIFLLTFVGEYFGR